VADSTGRHNMLFRDQGTGKARKGLSPRFPNKCITLPFLRGEVWWLSVGKSARATGFYLERSQRCLTEDDCPWGYWSYLQTPLCQRGRRFLTVCIHSCSHTYMLMLSSSARRNGC